MQEHFDFRMSLSKCVMKIKVCKCLLLTVVFRQIEAQAIVHQLALLELLLLFILQIISGNWIEVSSGLTALLHRTQTLLCVHRLRQTHV